VYLVITDMRNQSRRCASSECNKLWCRRTHTWSVGTAGPPWGPGLEFGPPHPLVYRKRRENGATCLPWVASCVGGWRGPGGWG